MANMGLGGWVGGGNNVITEGCFGGIRLSIYLSCKVNLLMFEGFQEGGLFRVISVRLCASFLGSRPVRGFGMELCILKWKRRGSFVF